MKAENHTPENEGKKVQLVIEFYVLKVLATFRCSGVNF